MFLEIMCYLCVITSMAACMWHHFLLALIRSKKCFIRTCHLASAGIWYSNDRFREASSHHWSAPLSSAECYFKSTLGTRVLLLERGGERACMLIWLQSPHISWGSGSTCLFWESSLGWYIGQLNCDSTDVLGLAPDLLSEQSCSR